MYESVCIKGSPTETEASFFVRGIRAGKEEEEKACFYILLGVYKKGDLVDNPIA